MILIHWFLGCLVCFLSSIAVHFLCDSYRVPKPLAQVLAMAISVPLFLWALQGKIL